MTAKMGTIMMLISFEHSTVPKMENLTKFSLDGEKGKNYRVLPAQLRSAAFFRGLKIAKRPREPCPGISIRRNNSNLVGIKAKHSA